MGKNSIHPLWLWPTFCGPLGSDCVRVIMDWEAVVTHLCVCILVGANVDLPRPFLWVAQGQFLGFDSSPVAKVGV